MGGRVFDVEEKGNFLCLRHLTFPRSLCITKQNALPPREDHRTLFYEACRGVAEEYDKEFMTRS